MAAPAPAPKRDASHWVFLAFFGGLGALFAYFAWSQAAGHLALTSRGQRAEATILRYEEVRGRRSTSWYPVFQFATAEGRKVEATSGVSADPAALPRGQRLAVLYDPADPSNVRLAVAVEAGMGVTPWILGGLAVLMFAGAAVFAMPARAPRTG